MKTPGEVSPRGRLRALRSLSLAAKVARDSGPGLILNPPVL